MAADLQVIALEELMKKSPSPEREDVPLCEERRTWSGRTEIDEIESCLAMFDNNLRIFDLLFDLF